MQSLAIPIVTDLPKLLGASPPNSDDSLVTDRHPTARARLTLTMRLQSFLPGSGEAEHAWLARSMAL